MKPTAALAELRKKRNNKPAAPNRVRVGMATCGISAGADKVFAAFADAAKSANLDNLEVISTGCVGRCDLEPMAEVLRNDEPPVMYVHLDEEKAKRIVEEHLVGGKIVEEYVG